MLERSERMGFRPLRESVGGPSYTSQLAIVHVEGLPVFHVFLQRITMDHMEEPNAMSSNPRAQTKELVLLLDRVHEIQTPSLPGPTLIS